MEWVEAGLPPMDEAPSALATPARMDFILDVSFEDFGLFTDSICLKTSFQSMGLPSRRETGLVAANFSCASLVKSKST